MFEFLTGSTPSQHLKVLSSEFTVIYQLNRADFLNCLKLFPNDYERFCTLRDTILNGHLFEIDEICFGCLSRSHLFEKCPVVHYVPNSYFHKLKV